MLQRLLFLMFLLLISCMTQGQEVQTNPDRNLSQILKAQNQQRRISELEKRMRRKKLHLQTITLGFVQNTLTQEGYSDLKTYAGGCASYGQMALFNEEPATCYFGLDLVYLDLNYMHYKMRYHEEGQTTNSQWHQAEAGVQTGLAVLWIPSDEFSLKIFARYAPSYTSIYDDVKWHHGYGNNVVAGLSASFGGIGIGADFRYGKNVYKDHGYTDRFTNTGVRMYACINF